MKYAFLALTLLAAPALAEWRESCGQVGDLAEVVMENRQGGISMARMMRVAQGEAQEIAEAIIIDAYDYPRFSTSKVKRQTVEDFRDKWYAQCVKDLRD